MHHSDDKMGGIGVYSDLGCCRKAVKEKISTKGQACLKPKVDIFYFNNSQSYPKSASARKQNDSFAESLLGHFSSEKGRYTLSALAI